LTGYFVWKPQGPQLLRLGQKRDTRTGGPGEKPAEFPGTQPEYVWFWGGCKYFHDPIEGNVTGGKYWSFQTPENAANPREVGSSVSDFNYNMPSGQQIIVRIEGFYWHIGQGASVQARDEYLIANAGNAGDRVERVNDGDFMGDITGSTAIRLLANILAGQPRIGALQAGTVQPPRYAEFVTR
jgi:hypothetical protein